MKKVLKIAHINEAQCTGCSTCLRSCPVDAIVGAPGYLHTVIASECRGCGRCISRCPMNCIMRVQITDDTPQTRAHTEQRVAARKARLEEAREKKEKQDAAIIKTREAFIQASLARTKQKKRRTDS